MVDFNLKEDIRDMIQDLFIGHEQRLFWPEMFVVEDYASSYEQSWAALREIAADGILEEKWKICPPCGHSEGCRELSVGVFKERYTEGFVCQVCLEDAEEEGEEEDESLYTYKDVNIMPRFRLSKQAADRWSRRKKKLHRQRTTPSSNS